MTNALYADVVGMRGLATSLTTLTSETNDESGFDLTEMRSDLVAAAAAMFAARWADARAQLSLVSNGLGSSVDDTVNDFLAAEQASIEAIVASVEALDG